MPWYRPSKSTSKRLPIISMERVTRGSGNVFADLGLPNPEDHLRKSNIVIQIGERIGRQPDILRQVAELFGISSSELRNVLRGRFREFSVEQLSEWLTLIDRITKE